MRKNKADNRITSALKITSELNLVTPATGQKTTKERERGAEEKANKQLSKHAELVLLYCITIRVRGENAKWDFLINYVRVVVKWSFVLLTATQKIILPRRSLAGLV